MKSPRSSILVLLLALAMPIPTEAFLADIFQFILSIFIPNWKDQLCDAVFDNVPDEIVQECTCQINLAGAFDFDVSATCPDVADSPCDVTLGAKGNLFAAIFGGVDLSVKSVCDLELLGVVELSGGGTLSLSESDIDTCAAVYRPPIVNIPVTCTCTPNCSNTDPFAVSLTCPIDITTPCLNVFDVIGTFIDILGQRQAEGQALVPPVEGP